MQFIFNGKNREKMVFKDEGIGMEYYLIEKMVLREYVVLIKLDWIFESLYF